MPSNTDMPNPNSPPPRVLHPALTAAVFGLVSSVVVVYVTVSAYWWVTYRLLPNRIESVLVQLVLFGIPGAVGGVIGAALSEKVNGPRSWGPAIGGCLGGLAVVLVEMWLFAPALFIPSD